MYLLVSKYRLIYVSKNKSICTIIKRLYNNKMYMKHSPDHHPSLNPHLRKYFKTTPPQVKREDGIHFILSTTCEVSIIKHSK